ncbi:NAD(P)H-quinone oxidoreductase [Kaistia algarum]|nr:NAD(P)H-quinone oxidoreductase [Kaistia algarum]
MTVIAISQPGPPEMLKPERRPLPLLQDGEILIEVAAAGVNRPDVMQRQGLYPPPKGASDLPGLEVSGRVVQTGGSAARYRPGDMVTALVPGGGYAEYVAVHETNALPVPTGLSLVEAAALPETFFTVWHNVFERGGLKAGEYLLVHGGSSGIGTTAIQLGRAFGAKAIVTAGSAEKCAACLDLGAVRAIDYHQEDFVEAVREATGDHGADVILDMVGGDYIERNLKAAAPDGRIVQIAFQRGSTATIDFRSLMLKRLTLTGSTLRPRPIAFKAGIAKALEQHVWPRLASGEIRPRIDAVFPLIEAWKAHRRMEEQGHIGKIMLKVR